jgi:hypothetical protein
MSCNVNRAAEKQKTLARATQRTQKESKTINHEEEEDIFDDTTIKKPRSKNVDRKYVVGNIATTTAHLLEQTDTKKHGYDLITDNEAQDFKVYGLNDRFASAEEKFFAHFAHECKV